jgi:hypothetical protein
VGRGSRHTLPPPGWKHWATACLSVVLCGAGSLLSGAPRQRLTGTHREAFDRALEWAQMGASADYTTLAVLSQVNAETRNVA